MFFEKGEISVEKGSEGVVIEGTKKRLKRYDQFFVETWLEKTKLGNYTDDDLQTEGYAWCASVINTLINAKAFPRLIDIIGKIYDHCDRTIFAEDALVTLIEKGELDIARQLATQEIFSDAQALFHAQFKIAMLTKDIVDLLEARETLSLVRDTYLDPIRRISARKIMYDYTGSIIDLESWIDAVLDNVEFYPTYLTAVA